MHCPKCGESLAFDEARFCRLCGFEMEEIKELLGVEANDAKRQRDHARQKAFRQGMLLALISMALTVINIVLRDAFSFPQIYGKILAITIMMSAMARMIWPYLVDRSGTARQEKRLLQRAKTTSNLLASPDYSMDNRGFHKVEEFAPPAITERTTHLLDDEQNRSVLRSSLSTRIMNFAIAKTIHASNEGV